MIIQNIGVFRYENKQEFAEWFVIIGVSNAQISISRLATLSMFRDIRCEGKTEFNKSR